VMRREQNQDADTTLAPSLEMGADGVLTESAEMADANIAVLLGGGARPACNGRGTRRSPGRSHEKRRRRNIGRVVD
jgi:hypothetical protein